MKILQPFFLSLFFSGIALSAVAQKIETSINWVTTVPDPGNTILYNPKQKLTIADFKGAPDNNSDAAAVTASGMMFTAGYHSKGDKATLSVGVYCNFNKRESWMKEKGKNAYILEHEQHHFDISYLHTLLFIKKVKQAKFRADDYMDQLKDIYKEAVAKMEAMQHAYDTETGNGINTEKQAAWNEKIKEKLEEVAE